MAHRPSTNGDPWSRWLWCLVLGCGGIPCCSLQAAPVVRVKDIADVYGVRINQLTGMGLVTGLKGTGGKTPATREYAFNLLQNFGARLDPDQRLILRLDTQQKTDNMSLVTLNANLPPFARRGQRIDVLVAAFDDAKSLNGGVLIRSPLYGVDGQVYAVAAGPVSTGGFSFSGNAATVTNNHPTSGRIAAGATVECEVPFELGSGGSVKLLLRQPDFATAHRIAQQINRLHPGTAQPLDATTIEVLVPQTERGNVVRFVDAVQSLPVQPDVPARVVINERTGTVVVGDDVRISRVAVTHANLSVVTSESPLVSQPAPFSEGETTLVPRTQLDVFDGKQPMHVFENSVTVGDLASALNALGVTPRDLSSIFQQLHSAGALHAELIIN